MNSDDSRPDSESRERCDTLPPSSRSSYFQSSDESSRDCTLLLDSAYSKSFSSHNYSFGPLSYPRALPTLIRADKYFPYAPRLLRQGIGASQIAYPNFPDAETGPRRDHLPSRETAYYATTRSRKRAPPHALQPSSQSADIGD